MANTADRLVVIGRGRLIAATTMAEFLSRSGVDSVRVRSPQIMRMHEILTAARLSVDRDGDVLLVRGASAVQVGELAAQYGLTLHELASQQVSLEEAYMNLTDEAVDYRAGGASQ
jgi:ABC-2 type transport system ATP-binding protein